MNRQELIELLDAVGIINEQLYQQLGPDNNKLVYVIVEPFLNVVSVEIGEYLIWYSENDDREWIEKDYAANGKCIEAGYELWDNYLKRKINELVADIAKIKL